MAFGLIGFIIMGYVIVSILSRKKFPTTRVSSVDLQKNAFLKFFYKLMMFQEKSCYNS